MTNAKPTPPKFWLVRWAVLAGCLLLCWAGHMVSRLLVPLSARAFYPLYNNLMHRSIFVNDKYGLSVWRDAEPDDNDKNPTV